MIKAIQIAYNDLFELKCNLASKAGFKHIAVNYTEILGKTEYEWQKITEDIQRILDENNLACVQTHPHYYDLLISSEIIDENFEFCIRQSIISSGAVGAEYCVFHPRSSISTGYSRLKSLEDNRKYFTEYFELALNHGTSIAAENLPIFPSQKKIMPFYSSSFEDLSELVDSFGDQRFKVCWDFGHANLLDYDQTEAIKCLGKRIGCTHVHNNYGWRDDHSTPDIGNIPWDKVMAAFSEIGYNGPLTLETHCNYPERDLLFSFAKHNLSCLDYLEKLMK